MSNTIATDTVPTLDLDPTPKRKLDLKKVAKWSALALTGIASTLVIIDYARKLPEKVEVDLDVTVGDSTD